MSKQLFILYFMYVSSLLIYPLSCTSIIIDQSVNNSYLIEYDMVQGDTQSNTITLNYWIRIYHIGIAIEPSREHIQNELKGTQAGLWDCHWTEGVSDLSLDTINTSIQANLHLPLYYLRSYLSTQTIPTRSRV